MQLEREIDKALSAIGTEKRVVIFGLNGYIDAILTCLNSNQINIIAIFDNSKNKIGKLYNNIEVCLPTDKYISDNIFVFIASSYYFEMKKQLLAMGYKSQNIIRLRKDTEGRQLLSEELNEMIEEIRAGEVLFTNILAQYDKNTSYFMTPVSSIGDVFLFSIYWEQYLKEKNVKKYVLLLTGSTSARLAKNLGLQNIHVLNTQDSKAICLYLKVTGFKKNNVTLLHTGFIHTSVRSRLLTTKKTTWLDHYREIFNLPIDTKKQARALVGDSEELKNIVDTYNLIQNKTIIISPYTNTIPELNNLFWIMLSKKLKEMGYQVFTNVSNMEKSIEGTEPISFPLEIAKDILDYSGYFIALRNGLCDVVCTSSAKKIVIYPEIFFDNVSLYDFYSFERMQIGRNFIEIEDKCDSNESLMNRVLVDGGFI